VLTLPKLGSEMLASIPYYQAGIFVWGVRGGVSSNQNFSKMLENSCMLYYYIQLKGESYRFHWNSDHPSEKTNNSDCQDSYDCYTLESD